VGPESTACEYSLELDVCIVSFSVLKFLVEVVVMSGSIAFEVLSCAASNLLGNVMNRGHSIGLRSKPHFNTSDAIWLQA
jgi:hypothetical protein